MGTKQFSNYDDLLTYTRASKGHALRPVSYGSELSPNATFTGNIDGWRALNANATVTAENNELKVSNATVSGAILNSSITVEVGKMYKVTATSTSATGNHMMRLGSGTSTSSDILLGTSSSIPTTFTHTFVATSTVLWIYLRNSSSNQTTTWDNVSVKEVTFDESDGTLTLFEHPDNVPRVEWDADGNRLGLLVEEQRTNNITNSESCSFVDESGGTVTASTTPAPYGTSSTVKRIQSSTLNGGGKLQVTILTGGDNYCSVYVRSRTGADQNLKITASGTTGATQVAPASGDWVRLGRVASLGAGSRDMRVLSTGDTIDLDIALPQVELGSFPTSYIKTTGSTATRSADVVSIPVADFGYNQSAGTILVNFALDNTTSNKRLFSLNDGGTTERIDGLINSANSAVLFAVDNNSNVVNQSVSGYVDAEFSKVAASYKLNDYGLTIDGETPVSDTSATVPTITTLTIGTGPASAPINGHIKSIKYFPRRLTNAQLVDLTS